MERIMKFIQSQAELGRQVALEGPPVYLYPERPAQRPNSAAFIRGWELLDGILHSLPAEIVTQWNLLDDFNHRPSEAPRPSATDAISQLLSFSPKLRSLRAFCSIPASYNEAGTGYWESQFVTEGNNSCLNLDSQFQTLKLASVLTSQIERQGLDWQRARRQELEARLNPSPLLLMIHPDEFRPQQAGMLSYMLGHMKVQRAGGSIYQKISGERRRSLLTQSYLHVWLDQDGGINGVTQPIWSSQRPVFEHREVILNG